MATAPSADPTALRGCEGTVEALRHWAAKMQPRDRLVVLLAEPGSPMMPELEWKHLGGPLWSGRRPVGGLRL